MRISRNKDPDRQAIHWVLQVHKLKGGTPDFREILRQTHNEEKLEQRENEQRAKNFIIRGLA